MRTRPCPEVKFVTRPPARANPSQVEAEECSDSSSRKKSGSPHRFFLPLAWGAPWPGPPLVEGGGPAPTKRQGGAASGGTGLPHPLGSGPVAPGQLQEDLQVAVERRRLPV